MPTFEIVVDYFIKRQITYRLDAPTEEEVEELFWEREGVEKSVSEKIQDCKVVLVVGAE